MEHIIEREIYGTKYKVVKVTSDHIGCHRYKTVKVFDDVKDATEHHFNLASAQGYFYIIIVDYNIRGLSNGN